MNVKPGLSEGLLTTLIVLVSVIALGGLVIWAMLGWLDNLLAPVFKAMGVL